MVDFLPAIDASLNFVSAVLLFLGFRAIKSGQQEKHRKIMLTALASSALFLICYVTYHYQVGSVPYPYHDWTRPVYFAILIPHVIMAAVMSPAILILVWFALTSKFDRHRRLAKWVWPIWMFVSVSGIVVYLMLHQL